MRVIVAGSRGITDYDYLAKRLDEILPTLTSEPTIISGGARGVDQMGERYAIERRLPYLRFPANWDLYGRRAGYIRNAEMAEHADALIAFWDGESRGTKHMIDEAMRMKLTVVVVDDTTKGAQQ